MKDKLQKLKQYIFIITHIWRRGNASKEIRDIDNERNVLKISHYMLSNNSLCIFVHQESK